MCERATPATQKERRCHQVPPLPREGDVDVSVCQSCVCVIDCVRACVCVWKSCKLWLTRRRQRAGGRRDIDQNPTHQDLGKNTGFRARECFHPCFHTLPNCYTSQLLDDGCLTWWCAWHDDDVVDMMMWLTWWCGCHDGVVDIMMRLPWWCGWHNDVVAMMVWMLTHDHRP